MIDLNSSKYLNHASNTVLMEFMQRVANSQMSNEKQRELRCLCGDVKRSVTHIFYNNPKSDKSCINKSGSLRDLPGVGRECRYLPSSRKNRQAKIKSV